MHVNKHTHSHLKTNTQTCVCLGQLEFNLKVKTAVTSLIHCLSSFVSLIRGTKKERAKEWENENERERERERERRDFMNCCDFSLYKYAT